MYVCVMDRQGKKRVHCNVKDNDFDYFLTLLKPYRHDLRERSTDVMPRLAADQNLWHPSATTVCVGPSEQPRRIEWELRSGASLAAIDSGARLLYHTPYQDKTDEGDRTGSFCPPVFFVRKWREAQTAPEPQRLPT